MPFQIRHEADLPVNTLLRAKLKDLTIREIPKRDGGTFEKLNWVFEITAQGDFFGKTVRAETSADFSDSQYNQPRAWSEALLQRQLGAGQMLGESDLIGLPCDITVRYEDDRKDPSKKWARVDDVYEATDGFDAAPF